MNFTSTQNSEEIMEQSEKIEKYTRNIEAAIPSSEKTPSNKEIKSSSHIMNWRYLFFVDI